MYGTGDGCVGVTAGDRYTLTGANNLIYNNTLHDYARLDRLLFLFFLYYPTISPFMLRNTRAILRCINHIKFVKFYCTEPISLELDGEELEMLFHIITFTTPHT